MNSILNKLGKEWEKTLFSVVLILILGYLGALAYKMLVDDEGASNDNVKPKDPHIYFDTHSFAYLQPANLDKSVNPLLFHVKINLPPPPGPKQDPKQPPKQDPKQDPKKPTPPQQNPPTKPDDGKKPSANTPQNTPPKQNPTNNTPNTPDKPKPSEPPKPTPPPPPPRKISVQYRGFIKGDDAQVAFYSASDSKTKKTEAKTAHQGAKIHGVLEIKNFDASKIVLSHNGKEIIVSKGKKQEIVVQ